MNKSMKPKLRLLIAALLAGVALARADVVHLEYEEADSAAGPWRKIDPARLIRHPDGTASVDVNQTTLFRARIDKSGDGGTIPLVALRQLTPKLVEVARAHINQIASAVDSDDAEDAARWQDVDIAPFANPLNAPHLSPNAGAAYLELKVVARKSRLQPLRGFLRNVSSDEGSSDRGYMIVSLDRNDLPVLEFSTDGETPVEKLMKKTGGKTPARIVRYGPTFWAAEDAAGNLIANLGTEPVKLPHDLMTYMNRRNTGDDDSTSTVLHKPFRTGLKLQHYPSYAELKADWNNSPVHQLLRQRRAEQAKIKWDIEDGILPEFLNVTVGRTNTFFGDTKVSDVVFHDDDEGIIADISVPRTGGFRVIGKKVGSAPITYRTAAGLQHKVLRIRPLVIRPVGAGLHADNENPHWKDPRSWYVGTWNDQCHWWQLEDGDWCPLVGCGPAALGMFFGYWDRKGVESAFYKDPLNFSSLANSDAPQDLDTTSKRATVRAAYRKLHEDCDVICNPFGDEGATAPEDLIEGYYSYILPITSGQIVGGVPNPTALLYGGPLCNYSVSWAYDFWGDDWDSSGSCVATGVKNGRPGVIGLGMLVHYGVAYGYKRQDKVMKVQGEEITLDVKRHFKVNCGWQGDGAHWFNAYDVFLGISSKLSQNKVPKQP
jgi:hypothetical protein